VGLVARSLQLFLLGGAAPEGQAVQGGEGRLIVRVGPPEAEQGGPPRGEQEQIVRQENLLERLAKWTADNEHPRLDPETYEDFLNQFGQFHAKTKVSRTGCEDDPLIRESMIHLF
jgi:hypothetical protein